LQDPRVFSIAPGAPFLDTLARALLDGRLVPGFPEPDRPDALARATIYLPTQRAARALATRLSQLLEGDAALLPRIVPLGEADDAELELAAGLLAHADPQALIAPPIAPLERRLLLAGLIQTFARSLAQETRSDATRDFLIPTSAADAVALAADLEALMDDFTFEDVPVARLSDLVDGEYSQYFDFTLRFLRIATEMWPAILKERQASDPAERRSKLIDAQAALFRRQTPPGPVIAAGSTGSIPSTARLLGAIARLENGALVLPGIDRDLDDESFAQIGWIGGSEAGSEARDPGSGHPQAMMARLVAEELGISREAIVELAPHDAEAPGNGRARFFSEAMRPAETTDRWSALETRARMDLALAGTERITLVEATDEREEALCIAIALREALEEPEKTAALITPDRGLAARVCAELGRWGVRSADSAGTPLAQSPAGRLARLAADAALAGFDPPSCLALIAHPHLRLGLTREAMRRAASALEIGVLRGPPAAPGLDGLEAALARRRGAVEGEEGWKTPRPVKRLTAQDWDAAADLIARLRDAFAGFPADAAPREASLTGLASAHRKTIEVLLQLPEEMPDDVAFEAQDDADSLTDWRAEPSYDSLFALFDECAAQDGGDDAGASLKGGFADYPAFFASLAAQRVVRPDLRDVHRRVKILGPLEARLIAIDRVVLGGLDEGVWPPAPQTDAFLNRPMRSLIGLLPPERRIGQSAHDFVQAACGEEVIITRAKKRNGAPTVPSRFVQRMKAFAGEELFAEIAERGARLRYLARHADTDAPAKPLARPDPRPDPGKFPSQLSVTKIETLLRDPYAIFAQYVLGLDPLPDLAAAPGPSERGTLVHALAENFVRAYEKALPPDRKTARATMQALLDAELAPYAQEFPDIHADWLPRLTRIAMALVDWEYERRAALAQVHVELRGEIEIPLGSRTFRLSARADRIEQRRDGGVTALDFKSGKPPSAREIGVGFAPQLTLEAAILMQGGFKEIGPVTETPELVYVRASGGREALTETIVKPDRNDARAMPEIIADHVARLRGLVARFIKGELGYMSRPYPQFAKSYNDYDHLARVREWSVSGGGSDGGEA
jgi:ATP-dependent helicase/nuclease subunit B